MIRLTTTLTILDREALVTALTSGEPVHLELTILPDAASQEQPQALSPLGQLLAERGLSPRQVVIMELDQEALSRVAIARRLGIRPRTVDWHIEAIKHKLGVDSISEVRAWIADLRADL